MKLLIPFLILASSIYAAPPPIVYEIEADFQQTQSLPDQSFQQGAGVSLRYKLTSDGGYLDLSGLTGKWQGRSSATSTNYITQTTATTVTNTTPDYIQFDLDYTATGTAVTNWVYAVIVTYGSNDYVLGEGELDIKASAWTGAGHTLTGDSYVSQLIAGTGITLSPTNGLGAVTITATAGESTMDHSALSNLLWTASGHTGTAARLAGFLEGGRPGYAGFGAGTYLDDDDNIAVSNAIISGAALGATAVQPADLSGYVATNDPTYTQTVALAGSAVQAEADTLATVLGRGTDANGASITNIATVYGSAGYGANYTDGVLGTGFGGVPATTLNWASSTLIGAWTMDWEATEGTQLVNYQTATNLIATLSPAPPANDTTTTNMTEAVTVPTQTAGVSNGVIANTEYVDRAVAAGGGSPSTGGGTVTNLRQYIYLNPSVEFADRPDALTTNNALISRTMYAGAFDKDSTEYSDMLWFVTEPNWSGNINIAGDWWTDGTTNLTATWACKVYPRTGLGALGIVTGSTETIQAGIAMTNRQVINATLDLSGVVATNAGGFGLRFGWLATNAVPDTRTSTIYQEFISGAVVY